ncbi:MAG: DUF1573 domain-containing protein [Chitinophagaceae bacterium]
MKKICFILFVLLMAKFSQAQVPDVPATTSAAVKASSNPQDITKIVEFKELDHNFGKIPYGKPVEYDVEMKNISNDSIKIQNVVAGCGCTTPKWQAGPYAPGANFKVTVGFNGYTEGAFNKVVTIYFDNGLTQLIKFHGETFKAPADAAPANGAVQKLQPSNNN